MSKSPSADWWRGAAIYQIYPRSFQDDNGDGIGDLKGITRRLDHVASLGVDAIWLSPFFTSPMADMGYDVSNYTDVDPLFGTLADFDEMIAKAHDLGLKVIIDQVLSHSSSAHPFFEESRASRDNDKANWYVWVDPQPDGTPPNNWPSVFGGPAWTWEARRRQYYLHNFLTSQPDFNVHNPDVQDFLLDAMRFWLERGVDGFRLDTVNFYMHDQKLRSNPPLKRADTLPAVNPYEMQDHIHSKNRPENLSFVERMRALTEQYDDRAMIGEIGESGEKSIALMAEYTKGDHRLHMAYSFAMLGPEFSAGDFRQRLKGFFDGAPDGWPCWSFSNHDVIRHATRWAGHGETADDVAKLSIAMLASFEGSIGLYQGEELGQIETEMEFHELTDPPGITFWPDYKGRDGCRTPMVWEGAAANGGFTAEHPWLPVKAPQLDRAVDLQEKRNDSVLHTYREVLAFRKSRPELTEGASVYLDLPEPVFGLCRTLDGTALTGLFNLSNTPVTLTLDGTATPVGPHRAVTVDQKTVTLGASGFVYLEGAPAVSLA